MSFNIREAGAEARLKVVSEIANRNGKVPQFELTVPIAEMLGTDSGKREFVKRVTYDLATGQDRVPLLYKRFYTTLTDPNFPETLRVEEFGPTEVVFLEHFEGGEIKFGSLGPGTTKSVTFHTWGAGIEYNENIVVYNQTWRLTEIGQAFGRNYNKLLNHLHLGPITTSTAFATQGGGIAAQKAKQEHETTPVPQLVAFATDIKTTLKNALQVLPNARYILCNSFDVPALEEALADSVLPTSLQPNMVQRQLTLDNIIVYDGATVKVGRKTYTYTGVAQGFVYLIGEGDNFRELIKHDLQVDSDDGDLSRLILSQVVGRARRAVLAVLTGADGVVKVDIAA